MTAIREQLLALAQKWRDHADENGAIYASGLYECADELTALADQLGPEQAQAADVVTADDVDLLRTLRADIMDSTSLSYHGLLKERTVKTLERFLGLPDEVARLQSKLEVEQEAHAQLQARCFDGCATGDSVFDELSRLRGLLGEFVSILQINETPYGKGVSIPTSIDGLLSLVERAEAALKDQQP